MIIKKLKELMKSRNVTQIEMADIMGVSNVTIHKWLSGKAMIKVIDLEAMANELGYEVILRKREK